MIVKLPPRFYYDHVSRELPAGTVVSLTKQYVRVDLDQVAFDSLLLDARYYAEEMRSGGFDDNGLIASARATVKALDPAGLSTKSNKDMSAKPSAMNAGLRGTYWNAERKTWVSVYDGTEAGYDTNGGRWQVVCERHGSILSVDTLAMAHDDARNDPAGFCEDCADKADPAYDAEGITRTTAELVAELACADVEFDIVTAKEAAAVLAWCHEWIADTFGEYVEGIGLVSVASSDILLRGCNRLIDGGLAFVLADVRRLALDPMTDADAHKAGCGMYGPCDCDPAKPAKSPAELDSRADYRIKREQAHPKTNAILAAVHGAEVFHSPPRARLTTTELATEDAARALVKFSETSNAGLLTLITVCLSAGWMTDAERELLAPLVSKLKEIAKG